MPIELEKKSLDLDSSSKVEDDVESFFTAGCKKPVKKSAVYVMGAFLVSLVVLIQNLALMNDQTNPQLEMTFQPSNNETDSMVAYIRESLKVATFFAQDFSFSQYADMDAIDSFDAGNHYEFYYDGYHKISNHSDYFVPFNGLDVFGCLIKDIGVQLSNVSKAENPDKLMDSLLSTYSFAISNFEEMYVKYKRTGEMPRHMDETKLKLGHNAYKIENFGKLMNKYPLVSLVVSLVSCMSLLLLTNLVFFKPVGGRVLLTIGMVQLAQVVVYFSNYVAQFRFSCKLNSNLSKIDIAKAQVGSGYRLLQSSLLFTIIIQAILIYVFYKSKNR